MNLKGAYETFAIERIVYGKPSAQVLAREVERIGARRVFFLAGKTLHDAGETEPLRDALKDKYAGCFVGIAPHTPREAVLNAAEAARAANADLIVTFGGGSITDAGKMVQLALKHHIRTLEDFDRFAVRVEPDGHRVRPDFAGPDIRQISIPTTLSGGEYSRNAGCTNARTKLKEVYSHPLFVPRVVILDPAVTLGTPPSIWLSTGVRALDHAVEAICSMSSDALSSSASLAALKFLSRGLPLSAKNPSDLAARLEVQIGVYLSMECSRYGIPMGASHGIGHAVGTVCDVPHGYTSCILLPAVLRYNASVNSARQNLVSATMDRPADPAALVVADFVKSLGLPSTLAEAGVTRADFTAIAKNAMLDHHVHTNPRKIRSEKDVLEILEMAAD